ncbi:MAG: DUF4177 domain-containing protein [Bacteroidota bacterium]
MREYKIIRQKTNLLKNNDTSFEKELNEYALKGWRVLNTVFNHNTSSLKLLLERDTSK